MKILSKEELLANRNLPEAVVEIPELGGSVRVRGLSRKEILDLNKDDDGYDIEDRLMAAGLLEPQLTIEEVAHLRAISPGMELQEVLLKINLLSGMSKESAKEAYKSLGE